MSEVVARRAHIQPVNAAELEVYPIELGTRLDGQSFVKWNHNRYLNSRLFLTAGYEVQGVARALFDIAQNQSPIGTLPDDDVQLSRLLHLDLQHWLELRGRGLGPLHNWQRCLCGDEVRWMHPVILEVALDAINRRQTFTLSKEEKAEAMRGKRLTDGMRAAGLSEAESNDPILMGRLDDWLKTHCRGNRTALAYQRAFEHAVAQRWTGGSAKLL